MFEIIFYYLNKLDFWVIIALTIFFIITLLLSFFINDSGKRSILNSIMLIFEIGPLTIITSLNMINDRFNTVPFIKKLIILLVIVFLFVIYLYGVFFVFQKYKEIKNAFEKIVVLILLLLSTPTLLLLMLNILISIGNIMN